VSVALAILAACGDRSDEQNGSDAITAADAEPLYFSNWEGEIGGNTLAEFQRRTGIPVVVDPIADYVSLQT
jgi:spermidine/putrescine-binding protein